MLSPPTPEALKKSTRNTPRPLSSRWSPEPARAAGREASVGNQVLLHRWAAAGGLGGMPLTATLPEHAQDRIPAMQRALGNQVMQRLARSCPVFPNRCPFGGACHSCPPRVQAKLTISRPGDKYEQEADLVAEQVMGMPEVATPMGAAGASHALQRQCSDCDEDELRRQPVEEEEEEETLASKAVASHIPEVTADVQASINAMRGGGRPLPESERAFFERRFGRDFSGVRVHTGSRAARLAGAVNARSFTVGRDIMFGAGQYAPGTATGRRLLAHELTHVAQQEGVSPLHNGKPQVSTSSRGTGVRELVQMKTNVVTEKPEPHECEKQPWGRCQGERRPETVHNAFRLAARWLGPARDNIKAYVKAPGDPKNRKVALALKRHFRWTEAVRKEAVYPDVPGEVEKTIDRLYDVITRPYHAFCPGRTTDGKDAKKIAAASPMAWARTNCYEFFSAFFNKTPRFQARAILHEMTHSWMGTDDVAYEGESGYPPRPGAAFNNADSYAALIRDIGTAVR